MKNTEVHVEYSEKNTDNKVCKQFVLLEPFKASILFSCNLLVIYYFSYTDLVNITTFRSLCKLAI